MTTDLIPEREPEVGRLSAKELATLVEQVAGLTSAGLPLPSGLLALGDELPDGALRRALRDAARRIEAGESLDAAIDAPGRRIPGHLRGLVLAGLRSGRLGEVLGRHVDASRAGAEARRRLWIGLTYPLILLATASLMFAVLSATVVPQLAGLYRDFGLRLPAATVLVLTTSRSVSEVDGRSLLALLGAVLALALADRALLTPRQRWGLAVGVPLLGRLLRWTALAEFSRLLGLLIEGGLTLPAALELSADGTRDADLAFAVREAARDVEAGRSFEDALKSRRRHFPHGYASLVGWGERSRALPEALGVLGAMYEARARAHASFVVAVVGILVTILVLGQVVFVIGALFAPMRDMIRGLSAGL